MYTGETEHPCRDAMRPARSGQHLDHGIDSCSDMRAVGHEQGVAGTAKERGIVELTVRAPLDVGAGHP